MSRSEPAAPTPVASTPVASTPTVATGVVGPGGIVLGAAVGTAIGGDDRGSSRGPTPQEMAAIVAAAEMVWPRPVVVVDGPAETPPVWRFSGRWWLPRLPVAADRNRP
jgi:hypothetical protein